jgi:hypothetical protein
VCVCVRVCACVCVQILDLSCRTTYFDQTGHLRVPFTGNTEELVHLKHIGVPQYRIENQAAPSFSK